MPSPFFEGLGDIMIATFGEAAQAVYLSQEDEAQPLDIDLIFNDRYHETDYRGNLIGAPRPVAWVRTGTIDPVYNDTLTINSVAYIINDVQPDGLELTQLSLTKP